MNRMTPEEFLNTGLLEQYIMGLLSKEESQQVESYINQYPTIRKTYEELENTIFNLAESHQIRPPASLKNKLMQEIKSNNTTLTTSQSTPWFKYLTSAAAILLGLISILSYNKIQDLTQQLDEQISAYTELEITCEESKRSFTEQTKLFAFYSNSSTQSVILNGNNKAPNLELVSHYNRDRSEIILDLTGTPDIAQNKMLCLWGDKDGKMILVAKLDGNAFGNLIPFDSQMNSLNITLEDLKEEIDHPDVSQLVASVSI